VQSVVQVRLLALTAVVCGLYFGLVFGLLDVQGAFALMIV
jgi:hypothetical protein